jgi:GT2 family glycosyltransferase
MPQDVVSGPSTDHVADDHSQSAELSVVHDHLALLVMQELSAGQTPSAASPGHAGMVEVFGRQDAAECWLFAGWISRAWKDAEASIITASFDRGDVEGAAQIGFCERADLPQTAIGFLALLPSAQRRLGRLTYLNVKFPDAVASLTPVSDARELHGKALLEWAADTASNCLPGLVASGIAERVNRRFIGEGYLDSYGYHAPSTGWFVCGWVSSEWVAHAKEPGAITAQFESGHTSGDAVLNFYEREDLRGRGLGFIAHLSTTERDLGRLLSVSLRAGVAVVVTRPSASLIAIASDAIAGSFQPLIGVSDYGPARDTLRALAARAAHDGRDTVNDLSDRVFIDFDEVISCPNDGIVLLGWMLADQGRVRALRLRSTTHVFPIDMTKCVLWMERPDVIESLGSEHGFADAKCGFLARVPTPSHDGAPLYLEIETAAGEIAHKPLPPARLHGMAAIKRLLGEVDMQYRNIDQLFDGIFGPSVKAINVARLAVPLNVSTIDFGTLPPAPRYSVIVPLYGRIDFMEMQLALFATLGFADDAELIYVLDDPPRMRETQFLAASLYARFKIPFRLLCLCRNMGYAPANNVGLAAASGAFICFLNSDVLPTTADWLQRLAAHLVASPGLGIVGPLLIFEDGSVQHQGIYFKPLQQFSGWSFPHHLRKGLRRPVHKDLAPQHAITGAAMLLRRAHALACGGFDEAFIIGDFEDTDLCFKLAQRGLGAAVDFGVTMHHLERKSQAGSASLWRTNLTLYNAWVHQRRWSDHIRHLPPAPQ